jgi:hypothetical protein
MATATRITLPNACAAAGSCRGTQLRRWAGHRRPGGRSWFPLASGRQASSPQGYCRLRQRAANGSFL